MSQIPSVFATDLVKINALSHFHFPDPCEGFHP